MRDARSPKSRAILPISNLTKEFAMNDHSNKSNVKQSIATLKAAYRQGGLQGHPSQSAVAVKGNEVLASWGSAMRR